MTQIPGSGFVVQPFRGANRSLLPVWIVGVVVLVLLTTSAVQAQSEANSNAIQRSKPTISATSPATPQDVAPPPVVRPSHPTVEPTRPPTVTWDGKQLTIDAENSTLADILVAVKSQTGASIDIPGAAWSERVFVHLGPGPPRDIISTLIYGLPFDYVVETAEDDPDTLRSVVLTAQGQGDTSSGVVVAGAADTGTGSGVGGSIPGADAYRSGVSRPEGARMMRGWASPGKTTSQAEAEAALAAKQAAQESAAEKESATAEDSAAAQESSATQESAAPHDAVAAVPDSAAGTDVAEAAKVSNSTSATSDPDDPTAAAIQNMTKMFQQRRQIQAQQNQPPPPSSN